MLNFTTNEQSSFRLGQAFNNKQALAEATKLHASLEGFEFYAHKIRQQELWHPMSQLQRTTMQLEAVRFSFDIESGLNHQDFEAAAQLCGHESINVTEYDVHARRQNDSTKGGGSPEVQSPRGSSGPVAGTRHHPQRPTGASGEKKALESLHGDFEASFGALHRYCELLKEVNIGTDACYGID